MSVCLSKVLEYEGKIENILENIFALKLSVLLNQNFLSSTLKTYILG